MAHWLFQHNPARGECGSGDWTARRYRELIRVGDDVVLWLSGPAGGVAAVGTVTAARDDGLVTIDFGRFFPGDPIPRATLRADEDFRDALVLRMPGGSNPFPLTPAQWRAVRRALDPVAG